MTTEQQLFWNISLYLNLLIFINFFWDGKMQFVSTERHSFLCLCVLLCFFMFKATKKCNLKTPLQNGKCAHFIELLLCFITLIFEESRGAQCILSRGQGKLGLLNWWHWDTGPGALITCSMWCAPHPIEYPSLQFQGR